MIDEPIERLVDGDAEGTISQMTMATGAFGMLPVAVGAVP
jgi:hypothetical protein